MEEEKKPIVEEPVQPIETEEKAEPVEEIPTIEAVETPAAEADENPAFEVVSSDSDIPFPDKIETRRKELYKQYKANKRLSNIVILVVVCLVIGAFVMIYQKTQAWQIAGYVTAGVTLAGMLVFYILNKNRLPKATKEYIGYITSEFNGFIFDDEEFKKVTMDPSEKMSNSDVASDGVYANVSRVGSRNVVHGVYKGEHFMVADLAAYAAKDKKRETTLFVGKYVSYPNKLNFEGRIIVTIKGATDTDLPTDLEGLVEKEANKLLVHAPEAIDYKKVLGSKLISALEGFCPSSHVLNVNIAFWGGHTACYISNDDATMVLPFEKPFEPEPIETSKKEQKEILDIVSLVD